MTFKRLFTTFPLKLRSLLRRKRVETELDDEIRYQLDRQAGQFMEGGVDPQEGQRAAIREFKGVEQRKEECRDARGLKLLEDLVHDLRHGLRNLRKNPGFTIIAVLILGLGIGANTAIFTMLDPILFRPLPYQDPEQLVRVYRTSPQSQSWPTLGRQLLGLPRAKRRVFRSRGVHLDEL